MTEHEYNWQDFDNMQIKRDRTEFWISIICLLGLIALLAAGYWIFFC